MMKDEPSSVTHSLGNLFDRDMARCLAAGNSETDSVSTVVRTYVDGTPKFRGKRKLSRAALDVHFWSSVVVKNLTDEQWASELIMLALTRYLGQEQADFPEAMRRVAACAPQTLVRAARYSSLVLRPESARRKELNQVAAGNPTLTELCAVLDVFAKEHHARQTNLLRAQIAFSSLTAFELLIYASLYAFEHLVPTAGHTVETRRFSDVDQQETWAAINDLLIWKIGTAKPGSLALNDSAIERSIREHLSPSVFPANSGISNHLDLRRSFESLLTAQIELNGFLSGSADEFSYNDAIQFVRKGDRLEIEEIAPAVREAWVSENGILEQLHFYWLNRAIEAFAASDLSRQQIGSAENADDNRVAYIRAMQCHMRLTEVYGVGETVSTPSGARVNVFQAVLALLLTSAFFLRDFIAVFSAHLQVTGHWRAALGVMAMEGLRDGLQIRFPLTWSDQDSKVRNFVGWTVTRDAPRGSKPAAAAILDFWTSDLDGLSQRMNRRELGLHPELFELPFLRFGKVLVQLPWIVGIQNNSTAAINTLRRLGARRDEAKEETHRIEAQLGRLFESRGFKVALNWEPVDKEAGEIDLICALDGIVFVLEVKSTFVRGSKREVWLHASTTLRKAGRQLRRKIRSIEKEIVESQALRSVLSLSTQSPAPTIHGWIVDTSIERNHSRFDEFLKVSVEELLIALRDDQHLLKQPGVLADGHMSAPTATNSASGVAATLYPGGFSGVSFADVINSGAVWRAR